MQQSTLNDLVKYWTCLAHLTNEERPAFSTFSTISARSSKRSECLTHFSAIWKGSSKFVPLTRWFHGTVERAEAHRRLEGREAGTFLVRVTPKERDAFVLTVLKKKGATPHNLAIHKREDGTFTFDNNTSKVRSNPLSKKAKKYRIYS